MLIPSSLTKLLKEKLQTLQDQNTVKVNLSGSNASFTQNNKELTRISLTNKSRNTTTGDFR